MNFFCEFPIPSFVVCFCYHSSYLHYHIRRVVPELKEWVMMFMSNFDMYTSGHPLS